VTVERAGGHELLGAHMTHMNSSSALRKIHIIQPEQTCLVRLGTYHFIFIYEMVRNRV
jgi:hypothetical protein